MTFRKTLSQSALAEYFRFARKSFRGLIDLVHLQVTKSRIRGGDREDKTVASINNRKRLCRVDSHFTMAQIQQRASENFQATCHKLGVVSWQLRSRAGKPLSTHLDESSFNCVLDYIGANWSPHWYFQPLNKHGRASNRPLPIRLLSQRSALIGVRIFEYVVPNRCADPAFYADGHQGFELTAWAQAEEFDGLQAQVWNDRVTALPQIENPHFEQAVTSANVAANIDFALPIDVVITWVDDTDELWKAQRATYAANLGVVLDGATNDSRFTAYDELRFNLRSIEQNMHWVRKIWLVTADQCPAWLDTRNDRIEIVSHTQIGMPESSLPVFNSHAIEANLHRIPGLAEHYLYLNDDVLITRPIAPELFFCSPHISKIFHSRALVEHSPEHLELGASTVVAKNARAVLRQSFSRKFFHTPAAIRKSIMFEMESLYRNLFEETTRSRFRSLRDIAASGSLYFNYCLENGHAVPGSIRYSYISLFSPEALKKLETVGQRKNFDTVVINDGDDSVSSSERQMMRVELPKVLERLFPVPSSFEK